MSQHDRSIFTSASVSEHPAGNPLPPPQNNGVKTLLIVLAGFAVVTMLACCGVGAIVWNAVRSTVSTEELAALPADPPRFAADAQQFNRSLERLAEDPCVDRQVCDFVHRSADSLRHGEAIPFHTNMFMTAISRSAFGDELSYLERVGIAQWLEESPPQPSVEPYHRILAVRLSDEGRLATVDLLSYSDENQCESYQWYLVRDRDRWYLYDWQRMEYGRRMSDEYAGFMDDDSPAADGYDEVIAQLDEAQELWNAGQQEEARRLLERCEQTAMLAEDRPVARMRIAYVWLALQQNQEAIDVLEKIATPDDRWGVWPVLAMAYLNLEEYDKAYPLIQRAQQQSPHHPNVYWLLSEVEDVRGNRQAAADAALRAYEICPQDMALMGSAVYYQRPGDVPTLLDTVVDGGLAEEQAETAWRYLLDTAASDAAWGQALLEEVELRLDLPAEVRPLVVANLAWEEGDFDAAAEQFLKARQMASLPFLRQIAEDDYLAARLESGRFDKMFSESRDVQATLKALVQRVYNDEYYHDNQTLLEALQAAGLEDDPYAAGLRGWLLFVQQQPEPAAEEIQRFADYLNANADDAASDEQWLVPLVDYYLAQALLDLKRPLDVLQRWPDDPQRLQQLAGHLQRLREPSALERFLTATEDSQSAVVRMHRQTLLAERAFRQGRITESNEHSEQAIQRAREAMLDFPAEALSLIRTQQARHLVWTPDAGLRRSLIQQALQHSVEPAEESSILQGLRSDADSSEPASDDAGLLDSIVEAAEQAGDLEVLQQCRQWLEPSEPDGDTTDARLPPVLAAIGRVQQQRGQYVQASESFAESKGRLGDADPWRMSQLSKGLVAAWLQIGNENVAREMARKWTPSYPGETPLVALVDLAHRDYAALRSHFRDGSEEDETQGDVSRYSILSLGSWLASDEARPWVRRAADQKAFEELLSEVTMPVRAHDGRSTATLLFPGETSFSAQQVTDVLQQASGKTFRLTTLSLPPQERDSQAWLAQTDNGQRILVHSFRGVGKQQGLSVEDAVALLDEVRALRIAVLDQRPRPDERLFALLAAAATPEATACWLGDRQWLWTGPDLASQLRWADRIPVGPAVAHDPVFEIENAAADLDGRAWDLAQWTEALEGTEDGVAATLLLTVAGCREAIPCRVHRSDPDEDTLVVRPAADGQLMPWIKQGFEYKSGTLFVLPASP
ncbi:tetratricopeptide repeat protein [Roseimaritima sediminicola]|uniref:hypothetical protein n=1 Tax=Roseimaritima sediminicola TaxID=2662066 RepID=UPI0012984784|nr:hypothetical protein [Roseimaritima sediminicola]